MTDQEQITLTLEATNLVEGVVGQVRPSLTIRCVEGWRLDAGVWTGSVLGGDVVSGETPVRLRWDSDAVAEETWSRSTNFQAAFALDPVAFVRRLARTAEVRFEFQPYDALPRVAIFHPAGLAGHLQAIAHACPQSHLVD